MVETAPPSPSGRRARDLAAATPETRNRYADLLRVASIFVVVIGHWLMAVLEYEDGSFVGKNLLEIATWGQLGIHRKPIGVLNVAGYYDPLVALLDHAADAGFVSDRNRGLFVVDEDPARLLDRLAAHVPPPGPAWITPEEA